MNKKDFLNLLRKKLNILEDSEIEDILSEYEGFIDEKLSIGLTEEEAVSELGDINEITKDLLAVYKIKSPTDTTNTFNKIVNKIMEYIDKIVNELNNKSGKEIIKFIIEICLIIFIITLFKIPFSLVKDLGWNIFSGMPLSIAKLFYSIWSFIIETTYFILSIILFIKIFEKKYFENISEKITETKKEKKVKSSKNNISEIKEKEVINRKNKGTNILDVIINVCLVFLKFIISIIIIGVIVYLIGMSFALGLMVYLIIKGVKYFGILLLLIAFVQSGALILEIGLNFVASKKQKIHRIFLEIISIVILTGIGLSMSAVEIANTEIIYENYYNDYKTIIENISMTEDIIIYNYDNVVIDKNLKDEIKVVYKYPNINNNMNIDSNIKNCGKNCYYLGTDIKGIKWTKEIFKNIIDNLKEKRIYTYEFNVEKILHISENNYNILLKNKDKSDIQNTFTKTYNILNKSYKENDSYIFITIKEDGSEEIETVRIKNTYNNLVIGKDYDFIFNFNGHDIDMDDIDEVFDSCELIDIILANRG
ncbi:MAG: DUF1700 domain-containing protein [Firmicutes bacterium]|nr:DUF1700 domain-containing protein [Bacillota bacterium]